MIMRHSVWICCAVLALALAASGSTYVVTPDGTGDLPTIQSALLAVIDGDIIELADGTFTGNGNRDVDFMGAAVTVRSRSHDPSLCIIECGGSELDPHRGFLFQTDEGSDSVLEGITIQHGWADYYGGGIFCDDDASPTITDCILYKNESAYGGGMRGGVYSVITGCSFIENVSIRGGGIGRGPHLILEDCAFIGNTATYGGGIYIRSSCSPNLTRCTFEGNVATHSGGGMHIEQHCNPVLERCTFTGNSAPIGGAMDVSIESCPTLINCTLSGNTSTYTGVIASYELCYPKLENTIISFSEVGPAVTCYDGAVTLYCCDVYGNAGGDWVDSIAGQFGHDGNISEDPLFCGDENPAKPFTLDRGSPCASEASPECGLVGAWDVGCGYTAVEAASWGTIKSMYR